MKFCKIINVYFLAIFLGVLLILLKSADIFSTIKTARVLELKSRQRKIRTFEDVHITAAAVFEVNRRIKYLRTPQIFEDNCYKKKNGTWRMVTLVSSAADHFEIRDLIRTTWGSVAFLNGASFQIVFVVGKSDDVTERKLNIEENLHKDLLQIDVQESYGSLANKSIAAMQWGTEELGEEDFLSKADDDVIINLKNLKHVIDSNLASMQSNDMGWSRYPIICTFKKRKENANVIRAPRNKNYVPREAYNRSKYPAFCRGPMYTSRMDTVRDLWTESKRHSIMHNAEDVWVTGVLREAVGISGNMLLYVKAREKVCHHYDGLDSEKSVQLSERWKELLSDLKSDDICFFERNVENQ